MSFVEKACGGNDTLRDEVESLMDWGDTDSVDSPSAPATLLFPARGPRRSSAPSVGGFSTPGLPTDLLRQSANRVRVVALIYAFAYFMSDPFRSLMFGTARKAYSSSLAIWGPSAISITLALLVAAFVRSPRMSLTTAMYLSLAFEVIASYGIAASEYLSYNFVASGSLGLSWVAVWTLLFTIVVPAPPRLAVRASLASASAVPVMIWIAIHIRSQSFYPSGQQFFFSVVLPNVLVAGMAVIGARMVYALGTEVRRARELGSYRLVERIGSGGMGEVWRARHSLLARPAAIKLIRPTQTKGGVSTVSDEARRRFEREAQAIARLRSPHTVTLFDFGVADDGTFYYVMELLDGLDTDTLIRRHGPIPATRVIHVMRQVCHSLSEAESRGLVHRDIKPANIFLCRYGEDYDFVKVLDFGIVKAARDAAEIGTTETSDLIVRGTPAFMAPEQALGESAIDGRADLYSAGCVAFWLLTGHMVFTADTPMGLLLHHVKTTPAPPSTVTDLPIPLSLEQLVMSCLAKDPADRPQSAHELSLRLDEIEGAGGWTDARAREWWTLHEPAINCWGGIDPAGALVP